MEAFFVLTISKGLSSSSDIADGEYWPVPVASTSPWRRRCGEPLAEDIRTVAGEMAPSIKKKLAKPVSKKTKRKLWKADLK
jgi:hypothetical protein